MSDLEKAKNMAQIAADNTGKRHAVINLNVYGKQYVIREVPTGADTSDTRVTPFIAEPRN